MQLITLQDAMRENFNAEIICANDSTASHMRIYLNLLQIAFEYNFITLEQRDDIAKAILVSVNNAADDNPILISNYVYAISERLSRMSNYEAWKKLDNVKNQGEAEKFVLDAKEWFLAHIASLIAKATQGQKIAMDLRNAFLISTWESCIKSLKVIYASFNEESEVELKSLHSTTILEITYLTIQFPKGNNYFDSLENYIQNLWFETDILAKLNAGKLLKAISAERSKGLSRNSNQELEKIKEDYQYAKAELNEMIEVYTKRLERISTSEEAFDKALSDFEEMNPDLDEEEFEELFDEYWMKCPEYTSDDYSEVEREFKEKKAALEKRIIAYQNKIDELEDVSVQVNNMAIILANDITLSDLLVEYAIFELSKAGKIIYPRDAIEKSELSLRISAKEAGEIFLASEANRLLLSEDEIRYLKC